MREILRFLNPMSRLGLRIYSFWFPLIVSIFIAVASEVYAYGIARDPLVVGVYIIFVHVAFIIYFSFRDGIKGGVITALVAVAYYAYIIYTRNYTGEQLTSSIETTIVLTVLFLTLAGVIGWLKQTLDQLIGREKNERQRLQTIIAQLPVGIVITDSDGYVTEINKKLHEMVGMKFPLGFRIGEKPLLETRVNGKKLTPSQGPLAQALHTGKPVVAKEMVVTRKDGRAVHLQSSASPIHNHEGQLIAAVSIITDVTQQKELEMRKDDFINMASHELKTPITSMKLYLEALKTKLAPKDLRTQKVIDRISYQTENLQELVSDLLDVSRIQTGKLTFSKETFSLNDLIDEIVQDMSDSTEKHNLTFASKSTVSVYADRFRIYQVLTNLLTNAIKYSPGGGDIKVTLKKEKNKVLISVKDFGIGVPKDQQKKIFDRLYQVTDPKEKTFPGLGMGLYISREIVKRHRGSIWVESERGKGSTFFITLPTKPAS
jgi:PAS domain S-box-containing protein